MPSSFKDHAAENLEEADAAGKGVGHGFEDEEGAGLGVGDSAAGGGGFLAGIDGGTSAIAVGGHGHSRGLDGDGRALDGSGGVDLEKVEKMVGGDVGEAGTEQDGEDAVFADGFVEGGDEVLLGDGALRRRTLP